jgi:ankyrin repeat protein
LIDAGASLDLQDEFKMTGLMYAARNNNPVIAVLLINAGANLNLKDNYE